MYRDFRHIDKKCNTKSFIIHSTALSLFKKLWEHIKLSLIGMKIVKRTTLSPPAHLNFIIGNVIHQFFSILCHSLPNFWNKKTVFART